MDKYELAWAAGFFDGEGYIGCRPVSKKQRTWAMEIEVSQSTNFDVLERFVAAIGIPTEVDGPRYRGMGKHGPRKPSFRVYFRTFERVQYVMAVLWPWLSRPKREQARFAFNVFYENLRSTAA